VPTTKKRGRVTATKKTAPKKPVRKSATVAKKAPAKPVAKKATKKAESTRPTYEKRGTVAPGTGKPGKPTSGRIKNPFPKGTQMHDVAALMAQPGVHSFEELKEAGGGSLSPRTLGLILVALEREGARFDRWKDSEYGICWQRNKEAPVRGKHTGNAALGTRSDAAAKAEAAATKKAPAKKVAATKKAAPARGGRRTAVKRKAPAKRK
jgi:hypothetical protein